jgi:hypothetical protein
MPTISQVTTITTAYLAGVFFHAGSGRSPLAVLRVRALGQGVGDEPGVPCPAVMVDRGMVPNASRRTPILLMVKRRLAWGVSVAARMP